MNESKPIEAPRLNSAVQEPLFIKPIHTLALPWTLLNS
jgi:hypothetical protein